MSNVLKGKRFPCEQVKRSSLGSQGKPSICGLYLPKTGIHPQRRTVRNFPPLQQGVVTAIGVPRISQYLFEAQFIGAQSFLKFQRNIRQAQAVSTIGKIGLHMTNDAFGRINC
uniref:hypothetical protein n=1 Tax=Spirosoma agri TaxID=1987381 RepID=UPI001FE48402|nr:hypothetical protein [Spirosoma agri]